MPKNNKWKRRIINLSNPPFAETSKVPTYTKPCSCTGCKVKMTVKYAGQR